MAIPFIKTSFTAGEITPSLFGHVDLSRFNLGASTERNMFTSYRGGAFSRGGTGFVGYSKQTGRAYPPRLITFQYSINQGLSLEFGNLYMRVVADGAFVTETAKNIAGATKASPCVVETTLAHGLSTGAWVFIDNVGGMTQLNSRTFVITVVSATKFSLQDVFGNNIDSTTYTAYTAGGTASKLFELVTPWAEADLKWVKFTQSKDVMSICCWNQDTNTEYAPYDLSRQANNSWTLAAVAPAPTITAPTACSAAASAGGTTDFQYVVTCISQDDGTESIASPIGDAANSVDIGSTLGSLTVNWSGQPDGVRKFNVYKATPAYNGTVAPGAIFGYAGTAFGTQFVDNNITPDFTQVPPTYSNPFARGAIVDVDVSSGGSGLTTVTWAITTATGSGFDGFPVVIGGVLTHFIVTKQGKNYAPGDTIAFNGAGFAGGSILFAVNAANNDTITLNGVVWTFKTAVVAANQTEIKSTLALTLNQLVADLSASSDPALIVASYSQSGGTRLVIRYSTAGVAGNTYTLAASVATRSGATLTGGAGTSGTNPVGTLVVGASSGTYPSTVGYFQQRRVYAGTTNEPDTYWMSVPGAFTNFDTRDPTLDDDAITGTPWSVQVNGIQFIVPMPGGLVILTGLSAWQLTGSGGSSLNPQPITPANQNAQPQAYNGCSSTVPPIKNGFDILYVQAKGSIVRDLNYNFFVNIYTGNDVTILSSHLFTGYTIIEWAWAEEPFKFFWAVRDDGVALSLTFLKEQEVNAWGRSDTQGLFKSVTSVTEPPVDAIYFAVQRFTPAAIAANKNCYMIERMDARLWDTVEDVWAVDAALSLSQPTPAATLSADSAAGIRSLVSVTNLVGGHNYSNATEAIIVDNNGSGAGTGAQVLLTINGGAITDVQFPVGGSGYEYPTIEFVDPTGAGSGATANPVVKTEATFTASANVFAAGDVDKVIRMGGGCALITTYVSPTVVKANVRSPIAQVIPNTGGVPMPQTSGNWTMTAQTLTVSNLHHFIGMEVTGLADGRVITPQTVDAGGQIVLTTPASQIVVGLSFLAQLQSVYLNEGSPTTVQGQRKKIAACTVRVENSLYFTTGTNQQDGSTLSPARVEVRWPGMQAAPVPGDGTPYLPKAPYPFVQAPSLVAPLPLYTGDVRVMLGGTDGGGFEKPGQIAAQQANPLPLQVLAFVPEVVPGDTAEVREQKKAA